MKTIPQNVVDFISDAQEYYGKDCAEEFAQDMWNECLDLPLQSPIEQLLYIAMRAVCKSNCIEYNCDPIYGHGEPYLLGLIFDPQFECGSYRADFSASYHSKGCEPIVWAIECDGHEFHERTKAERQYEKKRDRYFTTRGIRILHFTGSEIVKNPYAVAVEIVKAVVDDDKIITPQEMWGG